MDSHPDSSKRNSSAQLYPKSYSSGRKQKCSFSDAVVISFHHENLTTSYPTATVRKGFIVQQEQDTLHNNFCSSCVSSLFLAFLLVDLVEK